MTVGTQSENIRDMYAKGRDAQDRISGDHHYRAVLTSETADVIRNRYAKGGVTIRTLAAEFGVAVATIRDVLVCMTWKETEGAKKHGPLRTRSRG
jgi:hypothetical protein